MEHAASLKDTSVFGGYFSQDPYKEGPPVFFRGRVPERVSYPTPPSSTLSRWGAGETATPPPMNPILKCDWNMREIVKQMILLEGHVNPVSNRCYDCMQKHVMTIEGLAEEAKSLVTPDRPSSVNMRVYDEIASFARDVHQRIIAIRGNVEEEKDVHRLKEDEYVALAQGIRKFRKYLIHDVGVNLDPRCTKD